MSATNLANKVIILAGATSVGKSAVSLELVKLLNAEIVVADSVQVYRGLDIGANKPTPAEQAEAPHHLIDVFDPSESVTAGDFCERAAVIIRDIISRGKVPIVVGGSTMWIQWLVSGKPDAPRATEDSMRRAEDMIREPERLGDWEAGLALLRSYAPDRADKLFPNDWYRLRRGLEIALDMPEERKEQGLQGVRRQLLADLDLRCFFLMEDRLELYRTIDSRCMDMVHRGLFQEVEQLLMVGALLPGQTVARSIGYRQAIEFFCRPDADPVRSFKAFLKDFGSATRNYSRRQHNWYRRDQKFMFLKIQRPLHPPRPVKRRREPRQQTGWWSDSVEDVALPDEPPAPGAGAYLRVAEEVLHWAAAPPSELEDTLQAQIAAGEVFNKWSKPPGKSYRPASDLEARVLDFCRRRERGYIDQRSSAPWTAQELDVRAGPSASKQREYTSKLEHIDDTDEVMSAAHQGDAIRRRLWQERPQLMEAFALEVDGPDSGANNS